MTMDQASFRNLTSFDRRTFLRAGLTAAGVGLVAGSGGLRGFGAGGATTAVRGSRCRGARRLNTGTAK